jgi:L-rhamnose isomerase
MEELVRGGFLGRTHIGLDFFDASINRIAAWAIGTRSTIKALLAALLEPASLLLKAELEGDCTTRLALMEESKTLPLGAVWQEHCERHNVPGGASWIEEVKKYESAVLSKRA